MVGTAEPKKPKGEEDGLAGESSRKNAAWRGRLVYLFLLVLIITLSRRFGLHYVKYADRAGRASVVAKKLRSRWDASS